MKKEEIKQVLAELEKENNLRKLSMYPSDMVNFSSNDYLGLAADEELRRRFYAECRPALSSSSSRLITGCSKEVMEFEAAAEKIYGKPCLMFNSGFDANSSILETFYNKKSLIITDRLNHASIYDGIINSGAKFLRYKHLDYAHLESILEKNSCKYDDILVVTETVYSMDGDIADVEKLAELKGRYHFKLMIDEAHSYGVFGYGIVYNKKLVTDTDFLVIPLGKGGGSMGSMVICEKLFKDYLINKSRKFIFSTALPPVNHAWNLFILRHMDEFAARREKLRKIREYTTERLLEEGIIGKGKENSHRFSHIISIVIGDNGKIEVLQKKLRAEGFLVYGVKEPTVPKNTARFRLSLHPGISKEQVEAFVKELKYELDTYI